MPRKALASMTEDERIEYEVRKAEREANPLPVATERSLTVTVPVEAVRAAKSLATLSGTSYRDVLAKAAAKGVDELTEKVRSALLGPTHDEDTGIPY